MLSKNLSSTSFNLNCSDEPSQSRLRTVVVSNLLALFGGITIGYAVNIAGIFPLLLLVVWSLKPHMCSKNETIDERYRNQTINQFNQLVSSFTMLVIRNGQYPFMRMCKTKLCSFISVNFHWFFMSSFLNFLSDVCYCIGVLIDSDRCLM